MGECHLSSELGKLHKFRIHTGNINTYVELKLKRYKDSAEELSACLDIQLQGNPLGDAVNFREDGTFLLCDNAHIDHYERGDLKITLKVFLSSWDPEELRESVDCLMSELNTKNIELLIIATPEVEYIEGEGDKEELARWKKLIKPLWEFLCSLVDDGKVASLGIAEGTVSQLQSLIDDYDVRPTVVHLRHDGCCAVPTELKEFASDHSISLLTHNDPHPFPTTSVFQDFCNLGQSTTPVCSSKFNATWAARYTVWVRCRSIMASKGYLVQFERKQ